MKNIKLAYIGGGSKQWARVFMGDLAFVEGLSGEIALYDIDKDAAIRNKLIGERINKLDNVISKWNYVVCDTLKECLQGADFVVCSILPGTFDEMEADVHLPEKYGVYQSVGDTVGPGGVLRAMRTVPVYEGFARAIAEFCPNAWVINFTNPMTICTQTLYDVFPKIKAFGCCHEVFHAQDFLCAVAHEVLGVPRPDRHEIYTDASGINHFTWITEANYKGEDLLKLLPAFMEKYYESGYSERLGIDPFDFKNDYFLYGNKVKMDLFRRYGVLAAAGDRHLVEFVNSSWYLASPETAKKWLFNLTPVSFRKRQQRERIEESVAMANGKKPVSVAKSNEEACDLIQAVLGMKKVVSNVNIPNVGQMTDMPKGAVVETNCVFDSDSVKPVVAKPLPVAVADLVYRNAVNINNCYDGIKHRDLEEIFQSFVNQPLCSSLQLDHARTLFCEMITATKQYLEGFYDLSKFLK